MYAKLDFVIREMADPTICVCLAVKKFTPLVQTVWVFLCIFYQLSEVIYKTDFTVYKVKYIGVPKR